MRLPILTAGCHLRGIVRLVRVRVLIHKPVVFYGVLLVTTAAAMVTSTRLVTTAVCLVICIVGVSDCIALGGIGSVWQRLRTRTARRMFLVRIIATE